MATVLPPEVEEPKIFRVTLLGIWQFFVTISDLQALGFQAIAIQAPPIFGQVISIAPDDSLTLEDLMAATSSDEPEPADLSEVVGQTQTPGTD